jgi:hypothetical protein
LPAVLGGGGVEDELGGGPDVDAGAVALDEGDDRFVGDDEDAVVAHGDEICHSRPSTGSATVGWHREVDVDIGRRPRVAIPRQRDGTTELVWNSGRLEHLVQGDDFRGEIAELGRAGH